MRGGGEIYDRIGRGYGLHRRPDPRIGAFVSRALGDSASIVNVGAGAGSYEPADRYVVAVEPSITMIRQRPAQAAPVVQAGAGALPFRDRSFDAGLAVLTLHHWPDWRGGLAEMARVARRRVVLLTWDPSACAFWLVDDYFPEIMQIDRAIFPTMEELRQALGHIAVSTVPIPHDCADGFLGAYWRRPRAYLDHQVRAAISAFAKLADVEPRLQQLAADLASGAWDRRHGALLGQQSIDLGYRLVVTA
jgi:SAM-dependent methyltransferase